VNLKYHDSVTCFRDIVQNTFGPANAQVFKLEIVHLKSFKSCANMPQKTHWTLGTGSSCGF